MLANFLIVFLLKNKKFNTTVIKSPDEFPNNSVIIIKKEKHINSLKIFLTLTRSSAGKIFHVISNEPMSSIKIDTIVGECYTCAIMILRLSSRFLIKSSNDERNNSQFASNNCYSTLKRSVFLDIYCVFSSRYRIRLFLVALLLITWTILWPHVAIGFVECV